MINPATGLNYNCESGQDTCPAGSYCHRLPTVSACCKEGEATGVLYKKYKNKNCIGLHDI